MITCPYSPAVEAIVSKAIKDRFESDYGYHMLRITSKYFVAGFDIETKNIAPIISYMKYWSLEKIKSYCKEKHWLLEIL